MFDLIIYNGTIRTQARPAVAAAVGIRNGRIARVGDEPDVFRDGGPETRRLDLAGRTLVPGFNDAHAHVWKIGHLLTSMLDLREVTSLEELADLLESFDGRLPRGAWLLGRGYNETELDEGRHPTRTDLDRAVPDRPVVLTRTCGHIWALNTLALRRAGIGAETPDPAGGIIDRDADRIPTGILRETAVGLVRRVMPLPSSADYEAMIATALRHQLTLGITSSSDCGVPPELLQVYRDMEAQGRLPLRMNVMPLGLIDGSDEPMMLPEQSVSDMLRVDTVKFFADGGLSGATAALSVPYRGTTERGVLRFETRELTELARGAQAAGWRVATHAIGDVAIDQTLGIYETLGTQSGRRHRIEHFGLPDQAHMARAARLDLIAVPQPVFIHRLGRSFRHYLLDGWLSRAYPLRAMVDAGLAIALSSDAPVVKDDNPLVGIAAAITRRDRDGRTIAAEQAIDVEEALFAYTMGGAVATGDQANRGSIEPGKWADLAVLSADPCGLPPEAIPQIAVDITLIAGEVVFERRPGAVGERESVKEG